MPRDGRFSASQMPRYPKKISFFSLGSSIHRKFDVRMLTVFMFVLFQTNFDSEAKAALHQAALQSGRVPYPPRTQNLKFDGEFDNARQSGDLMRLMGESKKPHGESEDCFFCDFTFELTPSCPQCP
jgi:hypothetical protein